MSFCRTADPDATKTDPDAKEDPTKEEEAAEQEAEEAEVCDVRYQLEKFVCS